MELLLAYHHQHHIANLLWEAKDMSQVRVILALHGDDAQVVYHMMMASVFDQIQDTDIAIEVLNKYK